MLVTGDREAPLVLSIVPWAEPTSAAPPDVPLHPLIPKVIDYNRRLSDEPASGSVAPESAGKRAK